MKSYFTIILLTLIVICRTEEQQAPSTNDIKQKQRQLLGTNFVNPYYAFNPDYMGGNMPNVQLYQNNINNGRPSTCACTCGDLSFSSLASCTSPQICVTHCLQMYPGHCTVVNTYGCCGSSCQYFQAQSLETRYCTCNCAGQQFLNPIDTCVSTQACLTRCLNNFPQACTPAATQACCGQDCQSYSQAVADACACRCQGNLYYPSPKCSSSEGCVSTCMTTYGSCVKDQIEGCCGASCSTFVPTCTCNCGSDFTTTTSIPCQSGRTCLETCLNSYSACTQDNTQACCGVDCFNSFPSCTCMCGANQYITLALSCGSAEQCVQTCLQSVAQCNTANVQGCCGNDCRGFIPTCRCQCGSNIYYATAMCVTAEQCTNACISQFSYICTSSNTIGCCSGTGCTRRNRFLEISTASTFQSSDMVSLSLISYFLKLILA